MTRIAYQGEPGSNSHMVIALHHEDAEAVPCASFEDAFAAPLDAVRALAPDKPVALSEVASAEQGGSKAEWIEGMFAEIRRRPYIRALVWFNLRKETDWRIESSPAAQAAFAAGARSVTRVSR